MVVRGSKLSEEARRCSDGRGELLSAMGKTDSIPPIPGM
jgi:hypothetical protein